MAGQVSGAQSLDAVRAALLRLFSSFTLHWLDEAAPQAQAATPTWWEPGLLLPGLYIEPHVRAEVMADGEARFPVLRRVSLNRAANKESNRVQFLSPPEGKEDSTADIPFETAPA